MYFSVLLRCTLVYYNGLWCTSEMYFGVLSAPLLATIPDYDALSEVCTGRSWQLVLFSFCLCLLVMSLSSSYTFTWWQINFVLCIFFLSYSPSVTFDIQSGFAICVFCYQCLSFASEDCTLSCLSVLIRVSEAACHGFCCHILLSRY